MKDTRHIADAGMAAHPGFENCEDQDHFVHSDDPTFDAPAITDRDYQPEAA